MRVLLSAGLLALCNGIATAAQVAVLTPSSSGIVSAEFGGTLLSAPTLGLSELARNVGEASRRLTDQAAADKFDVSEEFARAVVGALTRKQHTAAELPIKRRERVGPLSRDEVPDHADAPLLLDIAIYYAGLYSIGQPGLYEPAVLIDYRWIDSGGSLVQSSRLIQYNKYLERFEEPGRSRWGLPGRRSSPNVVVIPTDGSCIFRTVSAAQEQAQKLWKCLMLAFDEVGAKIADDVPADPAAPGNLRSDLGSH